MGKLFCDKLFGLGRCRGLRMGSDSLAQDLDEANLVAVSAVCKRNVELGFGDT